MRYDVIVALVFATERVSDDKYDLLEIQTPVEADRPKTALLDAIRFSKSSNGWKPLGYPDEPVLCAVRSIHGESRLDAVPGKEPGTSRLAVLVGRISEQQLQSLKSFKKILLPYCIIDMG